ncbi:conserved hypothetical protein [Paraburkholderia ribeironis]|uniref:Uncharacterized protein n=1 Tax=Paraburkholderia ribeironis TaxID=1247936 RepID=A0A1N7S502_9BURK|nr:conserved hypothetical protein [Paraburkholderia ribeironis]
MQSFDISPTDGRIIEARWDSVSRADCRCKELAGGRDPANTIRLAQRLAWGRRRNGSYRRQEFS